MALMFLVLASMTIGDNYGTGPGWCAFFYGCFILCAIKCKNI